MIAIYVDGQALDIFDNSVTFTVTPYRFAESMQDEWSNDFTIPATERNLKLLDVQGLLYANNQRYGDEIRPATINIGGRMRDARIQVVNVRDNEIDICVFVNIIPPALKGKKLRDIFTDDSKTIRAWYSETNTIWPSEFRFYDYGMMLRTNYAQLHPSRSLNSILMNIQNNTGVTIQVPEKDYYVVAAHKCVCPQNTKQTLKVWLQDGGVNFKGGQHIANDVEGDRITFNRDCTLAAHITTTYCSTKSWVETSGWCRVEQRDKDGILKSTYVYSLPVAQWVNHCVGGDFSFNIKEGDYLQMWVNYPTGYNKGWESLLNLTITDYSITDEDYGKELVYDYRPAWLYPFSYDGQRYTGAPAKSGGMYTQTYEYRVKDNLQTFTTTITWPVSYYSYFGYWANVENVKISDILYHIAFAEGKKVVWDQFANEVNFVSSTERDVDGTITVYTPFSEKFGQKNFITYAGQTTEDMTPLTEIDSMWLEENKVLKDSLFSPCTGGYIPKINVGELAQYSNPEYDEETGDCKCDYSDVEGLAVLSLEDGLMMPVTIDTNGLDRITSVMSIEMTETGGEGIPDIIRVNGVKAMVTEGEVTVENDLITNKLKAIIIPESI